MAGRGAGVPRPFHRGTDAEPIVLLERFLDACGNPGERHWFDYQLDLLRQLDGRGNMRRKRISTAFYALAYGFGVPAFHFLTWFMLNGKSQDSITRDTFVALAFLAAVIQVFAIAVLLTFIYRVWKAIQDGEASTSPAAAAWLLLIPVFQLLWVFRAIWGFAKDYNRFLGRHGLELQKAPERFYLACSIFLAVRWTYQTVGTLQPFFKGMILLGPYSHILTIWALALTLIIIIRSSRAVNALPEPAAERRGELGTCHPTVSGNRKK